MASTKNESTGIRLFIEKVVLVHMYIHKYIHTYLYYYNIRAVFQQQCHDTICIPYTGHNKIYIMVLNLTSASLFIKHRIQ